MKQVYSAWLTRWLPRPLAALGLLLATASATHAQITYFYYTGGTQTYTVPAGVTSINVMATGASGGTYGSNTNYSYGGIVQATLPVTPGSVLTVEVGGRGGNSNAQGGRGGYNGGGRADATGGGGGGGATDIRIGGTGLTDRVLVAGGGGGGGSDSGPQGSPPATGGSGGTPVGGNGDGAYPGGGATQSGPGVAGNGGATYNGTYGYGGIGYTGPGGGGGYYGGGGTSQSGGGGGGSSAVLLSGSTNTYPFPGGARTAHDGVLTITPSVLADLTVSTATTIPAGTYNNITVTGTGVGTLAGNVTVNGAFVVQSGGTLNDGCATISGAGSFTLAAGGTLGICAAAGITSSGATGAVQVTGTRSFSADASYVYNGTAAQVTGSGLPAQVRNLSTTNASDVTLTSPTSATQVVTVGGTGNLALNGQALTLLSSAAGTALVVNSSTGVVSGNTAVVQRYIDGSLNSGPGYRHFSVPVTGTTLADFATSSFTPVLNSAFNSSPTPATVTPFPTLYLYNQSALTRTNNLSAFDKGWLSPSSLNDGATPGLGYCLNLSAGQVVDLVGTLYNSPLTVGMNRTTGATAADGGWALIGNPYPAPLDLSLVQAADRFNLDAAAYVVQSTGQYAGGYRAYVNGVSTSASNNPLLALGQGFFMRVSAGQTNGAFTFRNMQRVTTYASQVAFQRPSADPRPQVRLELVGAGLADGWVAYAETGATPAFDSQLDAGKLPNSTGLNLSSVSPLGENLAIDGQPAFTASTGLPLAVGVPAAGTYTLSATTLNNLPAGLAAYLRDSQSGQTVPLAAGSSYSFSVTAAHAATLLTGRFTLLLRPQAPLATVAALTAPDVTVYPNPAQGSFTVALPGVAGASTVQAELLNALGQVVRRQAAALPTAGTALTIPTADLAAGVYVLRLQAGTTTLAKRVVVQ